MARLLKPVVFCGTSLDDLRAFPAGARRMAGFQLDRIQHGEEADDWKPISSIGAGVQEIRVRTTEGAFRVIYVAKFRDAICAALFSKEVAANEQERRRLGG
jgi:phage-related protein